MLPKGLSDILKVGKVSWTALRGPYGLLKFSEFGGVAWATLTGGKVAEQFSKVFKFLSGLNSSSRVWGVC